MQELISKASKLNPDPDEVVKALQDAVDGKDGALGKVDMSPVTEDAVRLAIDSGLARKIADDLVTPEKKWASWISRVSAVVRWIFSTCYNTSKTE